ncbi:fungal specific transcription factor [Diplodia corticola]|uniref:Fungal specific transcription factor n=1 Tax=Diplodia corticola TaxID=236234 RepID=A0A1J9S6U0_9PEZI|nr:fungal specific transcription factor [Diplodia corticola]OJD35652.1 fungal specific transcription factor [Diplodia corticola]
MDSGLSVASPEGSRQQSAQNPAPDAKSGPARARARNKRKDVHDDQVKRRCCDGNTPACAACASVYNTECVYDPGSDHRRKGVYKKDIDQLKTKNSTLETLIHALLNWPEDDVPGLVSQIRTCESLDTVAENILLKEQGMDEDTDDIPLFPDQAPQGVPTFETQLSGKMGQLRLEDGSQRYIGGTSNLIHLGQGGDSDNDFVAVAEQDQYARLEDPITSWTSVTQDPELITHLINMYFVWHYAFFTTLPKNLFYRDFLLGNPPGENGRKYCTPLLVNTMLALGCHFTSFPGARANREDSTTAGDHFFKEAKRLIMENDEHEKPRMATVQALALMSVREAGCGREAKGWVYSGMSFRMACDLGLNLDSGGLSSGQGTLDEDEEDARRITFWGCFLFDKCWSNYLGRLPQLPTNIITVPRFEVFPNEDAETWCAYSDSGFSQANAQPARTRAVAWQISQLCEISNDLMNSFYNPIDMDKSKGKQLELKKLSELHQRLEAWRKDLPKEFEPREGGLPSMLVMHMFFQLLYIHLFRPFLKYNQTTSPLPPNVSPRKLCTQAAQSISKLLRLYKRSHGLRQICNVAVYIAHSACTIHLLNIPDKNARRDIIHGVKHLEEIAEGWLCARRTLSILSILARKWRVELPEEAVAVLARTDAKFGTYHGDTLSPKGTAALPQAACPQPGSLPPLVQSYGYTTALPASTASTVSANAASYAAATIVRRGSDNRSRTGPPQTAADIQYPRVHRQGSQQQATDPTTPANTSGSTNVSLGGSPSDLFGGVDALLRENQDNWWLRDQSQLAVGFDNWGMNAEEMAYLNRSPIAAATASNGVGQSLQQQQLPISLAAAAEDIAKTSYANGVAGSGVNRNGIGATVMNGGYGAMNLYNEDEWYQ